MSLRSFLAEMRKKDQVVQVENEVSPSFERAREWAIATRFQASEDLLVIPQVRGSTLDPSADQETGLTTKVGIDATPIDQTQRKIRAGCHTSLQENCQVHS